MLSQPNVLGTLILRAILGKWEAKELKQLGSIEPLGRLIRSLSGVDRLGQGAGEKIDCRIESASARDSLRKARESSCDQGLATLGEKRFTLRSKYLSAFSIKTRVWE